MSRFERHALSRRLFARGVQLTRRHVLQHAYAGHAPQRDEQSDRGGNQNNALLQHGRVHA